MEIYIWNTVIVLTKTAFYVGFACIAGYTFFGNVYGGNTLENGERRSFSQITPYCEPWSLWNITPFGLPLSS